MEVEVRRDVLFEHRNLPKEDKKTEGGTATTTTRKRKREEERRGGRGIPGLIPNFVKFEATAVCTTNRCVLRFQ